MADFSLQFLFDNPEYSDLTVVCGSEELRVHRAVVCARSSFFANACKGPWKENLEGKVDLSENAPEVVRAMIQAMYQGNYDAPKSPVQSDQTPKTQPDAENSMDILKFHAQVYIISDKYGSELAKNVAGKLFVGLAYHNRDWAGFLDILETVVASIPESSDLLPKLASFATAHSDDLSSFNDSFSKLLSENEHFAKLVQESNADFYKYAENDIGTYRCRHCNGSMQLAGRWFAELHGEIRDYHCLFCGQQKVQKWYQTGWLAMLKRYWLARRVGITS